MKEAEVSNFMQAAVNRRSFLKNVGGATAAVAAIGAAPTLLFGQSTSNSATGGSPDTPKEIFTAALVAEDLATVFYYNGLVSKVIQDPNLAGPGGSATHVSSSGSVSNVGYLRAAIMEEIQHADLFRTLLGIKSADADPYQVFYFPSNVFEELNPFIGLLSALENAFIGAYLAAIQEFGLLAAIGKPVTLDGVKYQPSDFAYFAKIAASILGIEAEHRALGRAISPTLIPANQLNYEQTDGITSVYNGKNSAVAALTPFLSSGKGLYPHRLDLALNGAKSLGLKTTGTIPAK